MDRYEFGQEDEGESDGGGEAWDDQRERGPNPGVSDDETPLARLRCMEASLTEAQHTEVEKHTARLRALDRAAEISQEPQLQRAIARVRTVVHREASGRTQRDSVVAQAVRRREAFRAATVAQDMQRLEAQRSARDAQEKACNAAMANLESRAIELAEREKALALAGPRQEEVDRARARRADIENAARGFNAADLGQGRDNGGGERMRKNRAELLDRVFRLGEARTVEDEADWSRWRRHFDAQGARQYGRAWGSHFRNMMTDLLGKMQAGDLGACLRWQKAMTRRWALQPELVVPGVLLVRVGEAAREHSGECARTDVGPRACGECVRARLRRPAQVGRLVGRLRTRVRVWYLHCTHGRLSVTAGDAKRPPPA
ncbi:MAG: hypothetical protein GY772_04605 [bacterium]|nr:hypothetical protein [bacterium]